MSNLPDELTLRCDQQIDIAAPPETVFRTLLKQLAECFDTPESDSLQLKLEAFPGGRWYRDLGDGAGHLWGHVQVIKPPKLLELYGPMFMSYPVASHLQLRLTPTDAGTRLTLRHHAFGLISADHREGVAEGWGFFLSQVRKHAQR